MKIKRVIILVVAVITMMTIIAGCKHKKQDLPGQTSQNTGPATVQQKSNSLKSGEITDPVELEKLWQEYIYDAITNVYNNREFNSAAEIDPTYVATFCWFKYISEQGQESLALVNKDSSLRLLPLDTVLEYANRYFNLTSLDVSKIPDVYYDSQKHAFTFNLSMEVNRPSHTDKNAFGMHMDKVTKNSDDTVTVVMARYYSYKTPRVELIKTLTLKQREDGSMYFVKGRSNYVNNHLVTLTGNYNRFDKITGFDGDMQEVTMVGEVDGRLILAYTPYDKGKSASLMLVNPGTFKMEKKLEVDHNFGQFGVKLTGDKIIVCLNDKLLIVNKTLDQSMEMPLPKVIIKKLQRKPKYDKNGNPDVYFGGYDVSGNLKKYVFSDETGVKLFNTEDNSEKLLSKTVKIVGSNLLNHSYHRSPRFILKEKKVITTMMGYECTMGYTLCDLENGTSEKIKIVSGRSLGINRSDNGLLEVNTYIYDEKKQKAELKTLYLDFQTGALTEVNLEDPGETGNDRDPDYSYTGQEYAAFITCKIDYNDNANNIFYINYLNLKTLIVEPKIISVKAAGTHILGVLADGRVIFWYSYNPSENGVCITK